MPNLNVDFYTCLDEQGAPINLGELLLGIGAKPASDRLVEQGAQYDYFLISAGAIGGQVAGSAARVRKQGLPGRFNSLDFTLSDLDIPDHDGVAEEVHFVIDNDLQTIALQRNGGFRSSQVETLFKELTQMGLSLEPKIRDDTWQRLLKVTRFTAIDVKLKEPSYHPSFSDSIPAISKFIEEASKQAELASIQITFKMKRKKFSSQNPTVFKKMLDTLRGDKNTATLKAKGFSEDSDSAESLDFMRDRIVFTGEVAYGEGRRLNGGQCTLLLRQAIEKHREFLKTTLISV